MKFSKKLFHLFSIPSRTRMERKNIMNYFTEQSIELANQRNYLDLLFKVYPLKPDTIRDIDPSLWERIEKCYKNNDNVSLFKSLLELPLFPVKDGYVPFFKKDRTAIERNPKTVNRICGRVREMEIDELYQKCTQPKETNRQMGPLFRQWLESGSLGVKPIDLKSFLKNSDDAILQGSDNTLLQFAINHLGYNRDGEFKRKKGVDFIARFNKKYVIGEAKFLSDEGGHQNDQFTDVLDTIRASSNPNVIKIGIVDGVIYIKSKKGNYQTITSQNIPIMSALVLRDFLYTL